MTDRPDLRDLLTDAVSGVEPRSDALDTLRARTRGAAVSRTRPWIYGAGGAVLATAATVTAFAVLGGGPDQPTVDPGPARQTSVAGSPRPSDQGSATPTAGTERVAVPVYFLGDSGRGPVLYREFRAQDLAPGAADRLRASVTLAVTGAPLDPDYTSPWPPGTTVAGVTAGDDEITVDLSGGAVSRRPGGLSEQDAEMALQQVVYSAQAGLGERLPVRFLLDGQQTGTLLGIDLPGPVAELPETDALAHAQVTSPAEGATVSSAFEVEGRGSSFEATMLWELRRGDAKGTVVRSGYATADGWMGRLYPFRFTVKGVSPGDYTLVVSTDDPSGGEEGFGPERDTKTLTVE